MTNMAIKEEAKHLTHLAMDVYHPHMQTEILLIQHMVQYFNTGMSSQVYSYVHTYTLHHRAHV